MAASKGWDLDQTPYEFNQEDDTIVIKREILNWSSSLNFE